MPAGSVTDLTCFALYIATFHQIYTFTAPGVKLLLDIFRAEKTRNLWQNRGLAVQVPHLASPGYLDAKVRRPVLIFCEPQPYKYTYNVTEEIFCRVFPHGLGDAQIQTPESGSYKIYPSQHFSTSVP